MNFEKTLNDTDLRALSVAMSALVADSCMAAEALEDEEYEAAKVLSKRLDAETNLRSERAKTIASGAPLRLADVPAGSICIEAGGQGMALCKWPAPNGDATCSPAWYPLTEQVTVIATGLSTAACNWVLTLPHGMTAPRSTALIRRRCAHLMAGGSIESYVETM